MPAQQLSSSAKRDGKICLETSNATLITDSYSALSSSKLREQMDFLMLVVFEIENRKNSTAYFAAGT